MNDDEMPVLGDGQYPARARPGPIARIDAWADEHDPFVVGTLESNIWRSGLFSSQARLLAQPRPSRFSDWLLGVCCGFAMIGYGAGIMQIILKVGTG